jgi:hypothetical protein
VSIRLNFSRSVPGLSSSAGFRELVYSRWNPPHPGSSANKFPEMDVLNPLVMRQKFLPGRKLEQ